MLNQIRECCSRHEYDPALHQACHWAEVDHEAFILATLSDSTGPLHEILLLAGDLIAITEAENLCDPPPITRGITFLKAWVALVGPTQASDFFWETLSPKFRDKRGWLISTYIQNVLAHLTTNEPVFETLTRKTWDHISKNVRPANERGPLRRDILQLLVNTNCSSLCKELLQSTKDSIPRKWLIDVFLARQSTDLKTVDAGITALCEHINRAGTQRETDLVIEGSLDFLARAQASISSRLRIAGLSSDEIAQWLRNQNPVQPEELEGITPSDVCEILHNYMVLEDSLGPLYCEDQMDEAKEHYANLRQSLKPHSDDDIRHLKIMLDELAEHRVHLIVQENVSTVYNALKTLSIPVISSDSEKRQLIQPILGPATEKMLSVPEAARLLATAEIVWSNDTKLFTCGMEPSHLLCGYVKAVEVFLFETIALSCRGKTLSLGKSKYGGINSVVIGSPKFKIVTLGSLRYFIENNPTDALVDPSFARSLGKQLKHWTEDTRNAWAHRGALRTLEDAETLRMKTITLLGLLLEHIR